MDLISIRQEIDQLDEELVQLLEKRMELVAKVVAYKKNSGKSVLDTQREQVILEKVANSVNNKNYEETIVRTFADIMGYSRQYQESHLS